MDSPLLARDMNSAEVETHLRGKGCEMIHSKPPTPICNGKSLLVIKNTHKSKAIYPQESPKPAILNAACISESPGVGWGEGVKHHDIRPHLTGIASVIGPVPVDYFKGMCLRSFHCAARAENTTQRIRWPLISWCHHKLQDKLGCLFLR